MNRIFTLAAAGLLAAFGFVSNASAQSAIRTFVKTSGSDSNPCTFVAPCRTLQPAINAVASGGEVLVLDSGAFGVGIDINKSLTISADPAVTAKVRGVPGGITVNGPGIDVTINGIGISGTGNGIAFLQGASLVLRNVEIDMSGSTNTIGLSHSAPDGLLSVNDSIVRHGNFCIFVGSSGTASRATLTNVRVIGCNYGVTAGTASFVAVEKSTISGKSLNVCSANVRALGGGYVTVDSSTISHCATGLLSNGDGSAVSVSNSLITFTANPGSKIANGYAQTSGNNRVVTNSSNSLPGFAVTPTQ